MTSVQFGEHLKGITGAVENLVSLATAVGGLKKGERLALESGQQIGKRELRSAVSQVVAQIRQLKKIHKEAGKTKKRQTLGPDGQPKRRGGGFNLPIRVSQNLQQFFATANLGPVDPQNPAGPQLRDHLQLLTQQGITSPSLLTPLFSIYAKVNNMQNPGQRNLLMADAHMRQYLGTTLARLQEDIQPHMGKPGKGGKPPKMLPGFDANAFPYAYLQNITKLNKVQLSDAEKQQLQGNAEVMTRLAAEQQMVSACLAIYRALDKDVVAARRRAKAVRA